MRVLILVLFLSACGRIVKDDDFSECGFIINDAWEKALAKGCPTSCLDDRCKAILKPAYDLCKDEKMVDEDKTTCPPD